MKTDNLIRFLSIGAVGCLIGLIAARIPSLGQEHVQFSWGGFASGLGITAIAYFLSRPLARNTAANPLGTAFQRTLLNGGLLFFLASLTLFALIIYTGWYWPRLLLFISVFGGGSCVFIACLTIWFGPKRDA